MAIAVPSGVGVALSVLGENASSLVGVAISASLLPPAVNAGIFFAMASLNDHSSLNFTAIDEAYQENYPNGFFHGSPITASSMSSMAGFSVLLTVVNILFIYLTCMFMFVVKEVSPGEKGAVTKEDRAMINHAREITMKKRVVNSNERVIPIRDDSRKLTMSVFQSSPKHGRRRKYRNTLADELFPDVTLVKQRTQRMNPTMVSVRDQNLFKPYEPDQTEV